MTEEDHQEEEHKSTRLVEDSTVDEPDIAKIAELTSLERMEKLESDLRGDSTTLNESSKARLNTDNSLWKLRERAAKLKWAAPEPEKATEG